MSPSIVVFFVGSAGAQLAAEPALDAWAAARGARWSEPLASSAARTPTTSSSGLAARVEAELDRARVAAGALDLEAARARLGAAETLLRAHPELPQAAWLMAERHHLAADLLPADDAAGKAAHRAAARRLEGPRAAPFGQSEPPLPAATPAVALELSGLRGDERVELDGVRVAPPLRAEAGEHVVRVLRRGQLVLASWVTLPARLNVPAPTACSHDDLTGVVAGAERPRAAAGTQCAHWAVARPAAGDAVEVATCHGDRCGPFTRWRRRDGVSYSDPPQQHRDRSLSPWVAVGAGAAAVMIGTIVLWQAGAFDEQSEPRTRWVYTGPGPTGLRF